MSQQLPYFSYHVYEQTPFDKVSILEGLIDGVPYFGVVSLLLADDRKGDDPEVAYGGKGRLLDIEVGAEKTKTRAKTMVISYAEAFQRVYDDHLAKYLVKRRHALLGAQVKEEPKKAPLKTGKLAAVKKQSVAITTADLLAHIAALQTNFDLQLKSLSDRVSALEEKK